VGEGARRDAWRKYQSIQQHRRSSSCSRPAAS